MKRSSDEPDPLTVILGLLAVAWLLVAATHAFYLRDVVMHAGNVGAAVPDWITGFVAIPAWVWVLPAVPVAAGAMLAQRVDRGVLRTIAIVAFAGVLIYGVFALTVLFSLAF